MQDLAVRHSVPLVVLPARMCRSFVFLVWREQRGRLSHSVLYSITERKDCHADSEEECEKLLAVMITEMKTEVAVERERLRAENRAS